MAACPHAEDKFYQRHSKWIDGKYEWYCASRAKYFEGARRAQPLGLVGYNLAPDAQRSIGRLRWPPHAFQQFVSFERDFYPLSSGECYVDFADSKVGGGVFANGLAQEETLMLQLPELLLVIRERARRQPLYLSTPGDWHHNSDVIAFTNVIRPVSSIPKNIAMTCGRSPKSAWPCTEFVSRQRSDPATILAVIAVNAQSFKNDGFYSAQEFDFLANKVLAAFGAAQVAGCKSLNSGALGAGVFNGNVHLTVVLHAVMAAAFSIPVRMWAVQKSAWVDKVAAFLEEGRLSSVQEVLQKLRADISWGRGRGNRDIVQIHASTMVATKQLLFD